MPVSMTRRHLARVVVPMLFGIVALVSCAKDPVRVDRNRPPETFLVSAPAESVGASYKIHLYWRGEDADGFIAGFLWSWDDSTVNAFRFTTKTDSVFELTVNDSTVLVGGGTGQQQPGRTMPHTFYVRAVDNLGKADPTFAIFNRRIYNATTKIPVVRFVGDIPRVGSGSLDTLCEDSPFKICWTGSDADGYVTYYKWDIGTFSSQLSSDTCAVFNDPSDPNSVHLISNLYTFTVTAIDNAFSRSDPALGGRTLIIVNHDPDTRILPAPERPGVPAGYYFPAYIGGQVQPHQEFPFWEGDTIPYRSTVYWRWEGFDDPCDRNGGINGYSAVLRGQRDGGDPYIIGFRNFLCTYQGDTVNFTTNNPDVVLNHCGFQSLVLDSLDAGYNILMNIASRDLQGRADGTPASFQFNCDIRPELDSVWVEPATLPAGPATRVRWISRDYEDGPGTSGAKITIDGQDRLDLSNSQSEAVILNTRFKDISTSNPHSIEVQVRDRAGFTSVNIIRVVFDVP